MAELFRNYRLSLYCGELLPYKHLAVVTISIRLIVPVAIIIMVITFSIVTIYIPVRMSKTGSILMEQYLILNCLVGAHFALDNKFAD